MATELSEPIIVCCFGEYKESSGALHRIKQQAIDLCLNLTHSVIVKQGVHIEQVLSAVQEELKIRKFLEEAETTYLLLYMCGCLEEFDDDYVFLSTDQDCVHFPSLVADLPEIPTLLIVDSLQMRQMHIPLTAPDDAHEFAVISTSVISTSMMDTAVATLLSPLTLQAFVDRSKSKRCTNCLLHFIDAVCEEVDQKTKSKCRCIVDWNLNQTDYTIRFAIQ